MTQSVGFVRVAQDSGAVVLNTSPPQVQGLFTDGLRSCVAIIARGEQGVALIHDGGKLNVDSIIAIFKRIGPISSWTTAFYPNADREYRTRFPAFYAQNYAPQGGIFKTKFARIVAYMTPFLRRDALELYERPSNLPGYPADTRSVAIQRTGQISTLALPAMQILHDPSFERRQARNELNNACTEEGGVFECNLQYDGAQFTPLPPLIFSFHRIAEFSQTDATINFFFERYVNLLI